MPTHGRAKEWRVFIGGRSSIPHSVHDQAGAVARTNIRSFLVTFLLSYGLAIICPGKFLLVPSRYVRLLEVAESPYALQNPKLPLLLLLPNFDRLLLPLVSRGLVTLIYALPPHFRGSCHQLPVLTPARGYHNANLPVHRDLAIAEFMKKRSVMVREIVLVVL